MIKMMKMSRREEEGSGLNVDEHESSASRYFDCLYVPFANLLYSLSKDEPLSLVKLRDTLQLLLLASSMMLSASISIPFSYDHDGMVEALHRWDVGGMYYDRDTYTKHYSPDCTQCLGDIEDFEKIKWNIYYVFTEAASLAIMLLALSTLSSTMCFLYITVTSFRGPKRKPSKPMEKAMWIWTRVLVIVSFVSFIAGTVFTFYAVSGAMEYNLPNPACLEPFDPEPGCPPHAFAIFSKYGLVWSKVRSPATFYSTNGIPITFGGWALLAIIAGIGLRAKTRVFRSLEIGEAEKVKEKVNLQQRLELKNAGIRSSFHDDLIEADFDVATLQFFSDDLIYRALCDAGISKPGHRLKIITALREYAGSSPPRSVDPLEEAKETRSKFRPSVSLDDNDPAMTKSTGVSTPDIADRTSVTTTELIRVKNRKLDSTATT
mmetsp:Transcript_48229/g.97088  ORF Transcript_48229/g.97088 Transcript_48229/m.97088 type:complete len:433 (+) Transcript_48229:2-1300(+)